MRYCNWISQIIRHECACARKTLPALSSSASFLCVHEANDQDLYFYAKLLAIHQAHCVLLRAPEESHGMHIFPQPPFSKGHPSSKNMGHKSCIQGLSSPPSSHRKKGPLSFTCAYVRLWVLTKSRFGFFLLRKSNE